MKKRILFLCVGNSARSQLAEALLKHQAQDLFEVFSAGTEPEPIDAAKIDVAAGKTTLVWAIDTGNYTRIYSIII